MDVKSDGAIEVHHNYYLVRRSYAAVKRASLASQQGQARPRCLSIRSGLGKRGMPRSTQKEQSWALDEHGVWSMDEVMVSSDAEEGSLVGVVGSTVGNSWEQ